ncbi:MAG: AAA family ATPase [Chitinivibrionales bacterium]|nr:AAA family ATPase [Chitinivibrionales bacterium]
MYERQLHLSKNYSFFLFGMRGTGKSTLLKHSFKDSNVFWIDLLLAEEDLKYRKNPDILKHEITALKNDNNLPQFVIIDEIQKIPALLDVVHYLIENEKLKFALTGSSARKIKRGGGNLLAGRAFVQNLFPLTHIELGKDFSLEKALAWGTLPALYNEQIDSQTDKTRFLKAYVYTYLREEILIEQLVRQIDPFYTFLEIAAQANGEILNYSKIGRSTGVSDKSVEKYYTILEDTLFGFHLLPWHSSVRKQQISSSKFYFHDTGIVRALQGQFSEISRKSTYEYGRLFESFIISEIFRLNHYTEKDYKLYYLKTKDGVELDLIVKKSPQDHLCIEIKSGEVNNLNDFNSQVTLSNAIPGSKFMVLSQNKKALSSGSITVYPWKAGLKKIFS